jgi:predicted HTH transcriptional regulator
VSSICFQSQRQVRATALASNSTFRIASPTASSAGVLLIAKDRFVQFPDAYIKAARFEGSTRSRRVLDMQEIRTPLPRGTALQWAPALIQSISS